MSTTTQSTWKAYVENELSTVTPILDALGYTLEHDQPHLSGERHLMQAVTTEHGRKLILVGHRKSDGLRVIIKATRDTAGIRELAHEQKARTLLHSIHFAYQAFQSPSILYFGTRDGFTIVVTEFIEQACTFLERPLKEQFAFALSAFKAQESAHATTYTHVQEISRVVAPIDSSGYHTLFADFVSNIRAAKVAPELIETLEAALGVLSRHATTIDRYGNFLVHVDFVPHNIRIRDGAIYLLDHSSIRFGNKYEGWARFINFMVLYNPPLADALIEYVRLNRGEEEVLALKLMRVFRLGEILWYYTRTLNSVEGNLKLLNAARVRFWAEVLVSVLNDSALPSSVREAYIQERDQLRSDDEKKRQIGLH
ncbi:MAG: hypothetical protein RLZZ283_90 [Candidatus Parcubacteria bacterium]|jgi:hypothetical protein